MSEVPKVKLKRYEKTESSDAKILSKISCKIGCHFVEAFLNTGSSVSIASTDLYRKLLDDGCSFEKGKGTLNLINDSIPNQEYRMTVTTIKVIGQTKSINLIAFPNDFTTNTTLGMDFLTTKAETKSQETDAVFRAPNEAISNSKPVQSDEKSDNNEPVTLLDWILEPGNLKKPLYNILADGTAEDEDLFAICAFMKRLPRMVSPIRDLEKPCDKKLASIESTLNTTPDTTLVEPVTSTSTSTKPSYSKSKMPTSMPPTSTSKLTSSTSKNWLHSSKTTTTPRSKTTKSTLSVKSSSKDNGKRFR